MEAKQDEKYLIVRHLLKKERNWGPNVEIKEWESIYSELYTVKDTRLPISEYSRSRRDIRQGKKKNAHYRCLAHRQAPQ